MGFVKIRYINTSPVDPFCLSAGFEENKRAHRSCPMFSGTALSSFPSYHAPRAAPFHDLMHTKSLCHLLKCQAVIRLRKQILAGFVSELDADQSPAPFSCLQPNQALIFCLSQTPSSAWEPRSFYHTQTKSQKNQQPRFKIYCPAPASCQA